MTAGALRKRPIVRRDRDLGAGATGSLRGGPCLHAEAPHRQPPARARDARRADGGVDGRCGLGSHRRPSSATVILADTGSPWYVGGTSDPRFDDDVLHELDRITGRDLEVVDTTGLVNSP